MEKDEDIRSTFAAYVKELKSSYSDMAYIHVIEPRVSAGADIDHPSHEETDFLVSLPLPSYRAGFLIQRFFD